MLAILLALAGCSTPTVPIARATPTPTGAPSAVSIPMPDIGPSPAPAPQTAAETAQLLQDAADRLWQEVAVSSYPGAARPQTDFVAYITDATQKKLVGGCLSDHGVSVSYAEAVAGSKHPGPTLATPDIRNEKDAVASYSCMVAYPYRPSSPLTPEQVGWLYDYLTEFSVPCYRANGIDVAPAPSRAEFIANWPGQGWNPGSEVTDDKIDAMNDACPPPE